MWLRGDDEMYTLGADPEMFLRDVNTGGVVPVCGLIGGTKGDAIPLEGMPDGFGVQEDNVMLEFNIPAANTPGRFSTYVGEALEAVDNLIRIRNLPLEIDFSSERLFTDVQLATPQAQAFGCSPDFDGYKMGAPCRPISPERLGGWRFAGGHVHIGYAASEVPQHVVAQLCDLFLGLPSVALDKQAQRRRRYGQPGRFRPTEYGIEYRTLSNFWVFDTVLRLEVGHRAASVARLASNTERAHDVFSQVPWADVKSAIFNEIEDLAADLIAYLRNDLQLEV
jgi:hypothetical protein